MIVVILILILISSYLFALYPNTSRKQMLLPYENVFIAHRGLFNNDDIPENTIASFSKAVENGYGIELDVQLTTDNKLVVFHDESLNRMTGVDLVLHECSYEEIKNIKLLDTQLTIPLFEDVLKLLKPDTPLIIEIKPEGRFIETTKATVQTMKNYKGLYNIESFNPLVVKYLKDNEPQIIRGQLSENYFKTKNKLNTLLKFILTNLLFNFINKPDYIAYDCINTNNLSFRIISKLYKAECIAWTIKSQEQLEQNKKYYKCFIFDSFIPKKKTD